MSFFLNQSLKFIFLLTPFFVLSMFLTMTQEWEMREKRLLALRVGFAAFVICTVLLFFGRCIFQAFGITLDAFRIGGGALLFLSSVGLVNNNVSDKKQLKVDLGGDRADKVADIAVVPLAIPITVGPGTIGAILVIGAESANIRAQLISLAAVAGALAILTSMLWAASRVEQKLGRQIIGILSKLTGLVLAAMASQMIFAGIRGFLTVTQ